METPQHHSRTSGFTLIELSIVLVIIGLLVGGVLVGRDLIHAARLRSVFSEKESFQASLYTFKLKYSCLPGDCANASSFGLGTDGDGNAKIDLREEVFLAIVHLLNAGLLQSQVTNPGDISTHPTVNGTVVAVPGFNIPASRYPGGGYLLNYIPEPAPTLCSYSTIGGVSFSPVMCNKHVLLFGGHSSSIPWSGWGSFAGRLFPCQVAQNIDVKYDDGMPFTGSFVLPGANLVGPSCYSNDYPAGIYADNDGTVPAAFIMTIP